MAKPLSEYKKNIHNGVWFMLHTMGEKAQTLALMQAYAANFRNICDKMGCSCENHCNEMLKQHRPEDYFGMVDEDGIPEGCLYHSWLCHNEVNERLGKPKYDYEQVKALYRNKEILPCTSPEVPPEESKNLQGMEVRETSTHDLQQRFPGLFITNQKKQENRFHIVPLST